MPDFTPNVVSLIYVSNIVLAGLSRLNGSRNVDLLAMLSATLLGFVSPTGCWRTDRLGASDQ